MKTMLGASRLCLLVMLALLIAFSPEANFMSVKGYTRWQNYVATGSWNFAR